jgi:hypothetical protein
MLNEVKNLLFLLLSIVLLLGAAACKNETKTAAETKELGPNDLLDVKIPPLVGPESVSEIEKLAKSIDKQLDTLNAAGPNYVFEGEEKTKIEVMVYSNAEAPQLIYCKSPQVESWYYLKNRRPVLLKEIALTENGFIQNRFYYGTKDLLGAETRSGASPDETNRGEVKKYRGKRDDFRLSGEAVTGKALEYLYGKIK